MIFSIKDFHLINYLINNSNKNDKMQFSLLGLFKFDSVNCKGIQHNSENYVGVSVSDYGITIPITDVNDEERQISNGYIWVAKFYGNDNVSYIRRFKTRNQMLVF